jgi:tetratricopeptide (TPR) repeat protein
LLACTQLHAQTPVVYKPKGSIRKAEKLLQNLELQYALPEAVAAAKKEKGKKGASRSRAQLVLGKVYHAIAVSADPDTRALQDSATAMAVSTLNTLIEWEPEESIYTKFAKQQLKELYAQLYNRGADAYNSKDYAEALYYLQEALVVTPADQPSLINLLYIAYQLNLTDKAVQYAKQLLAAEYQHPFIYRMLADYALQANDPQKALRWLGEGLLHFPADEDMLRQKINVFVAYKQFDEALVELEDLLVREPDDKALLFNIGLLHNYKNDTDAALHFYQRVIENDSTFYDAWFAMGSVYYNQAAERSRELMELEMDRRGRYKELQKSRQLEQEVKQLYAKAAPYFESAYQQNNSEKQPLILLQKIYSVLDRDRDYYRIREVLDDFGK